VEAPKKSGALITADFALNMGKDLWVASSGVREDGKFDKRGTIKLADDGAEIIYSACDVLYKWNMAVGEFEINAAETGADKNEIIHSMANFLKIEI